MLQSVCAWLMTFPLWEGEALSVDNTETLPGNCGLFPLGVEITGEKQDVLGNRTVSCRQSFLLRRRAVRGLSAASWMLQLQQWVQQQSQLGLCPQLGDGATAFQAQQGKLDGAKQSCTDIYQVRLTATYHKYWEGE